MIIRAGQGLLQNPKRDQAGGRAVKMNLKQITSRIKDLKAPPPWPLEPFSRRVAGVMALFGGPPREPYLLLTKKAADLPEHPGQISFPGGGREAGDADILKTALRETYEEIGLPPESIKVLAPLWPQPVLRTWLIYPFVGIIKGSAKNPPRFQINSAEVAKLILVPWRDLRDQHQPSCHRWPEPDRGRRYLLPANEVLWGATASIVGRLLDFLDNHEP